jgi:hypothetical protein
VKYAAPAPIAIYLHALSLPFSWLAFCFARFEYTRCAVFQSPSLNLAEFDDRRPSADSLAARPFDKSGVGLMQLHSWPVSQVPMSFLV